MASEKETLSPRRIAEKIVDDVSRRVLCLKPLYDSVDLGERLIAQALESTVKDGWRPDRESIARIVEPYAWSFHDRHIANPVMAAECREETSGSLKRADAILALGVSLSEGEEPDNSSLPPIALPDAWRDISTAPRCVSSSDRDTGRRPVLVTHWPFNGHHAPIAVARLTSAGWINGRKGHGLWFEPTHWMPLPAPPTCPSTEKGGSEPKSAQPQDVGGKR